MPKVLRWTASDTAIRPRVDLTRNGAAIDLTNASRISMQFSRVVASGQTALVASYLATVYNGTNPDAGFVECLHYASAPLATAGFWRQQVTITSAAGVETFDTPTVVDLRARY